MNIRSLITTDLIIEYNLPADSWYVYCQELDAYIVLDSNLLASGGEGSVYSSVGIIKKSKDELSFEINKQYAVKIINMIIPETDDEIRFAKQIPYCAMKSPIIIDNVSYLVMKKIEGKNLRAEFKDIQYVNLSPLERIELSLKILYQLEEQIHQRDIIHLDIKPENIILRKKYNRNNEFYYSPRIIDFGLSLPAKNKELINTPKVNKFTVGTRGYFAPEVNKEYSCKQSDNYSLAVVLAEIFGHEVTKLEQFNHFKKGIFERKFKLDALEDENLDANIIELISKTIHGLAEVKINNRLSIKQAIDNFNWIRVRLKCSCIDSQYHQSVEKSSFEAVRARKKLRKLNCTLSQSKKIILKALKKIDDNEYALAEFFEVTNIKLLQGCKSKQEVIKIINSINYDKFKLSKKLFNIINNNHYKSPEKLDHITKIYNSIDQCENEKLKKILEIRSRMNTTRVSTKSNLKVQLLNAIEKYMASTINVKNVDNHDRAASSRRIKDINYILCALESEDYSDEELVMLIKNRFRSPEFTTGFFGRSSLRDGMMKVINAREIPAKNVRG